MQGQSSIFFSFQLKIKSEREHEEAQRERSKQQLEQAKQAGVEKLVSWLEVMIKKLKRQHFK